MRRSSIPRTEEDVLGPLMLRLIGTTAALMVPLLCLLPWPVIIFSILCQLLIVPVWAVLGLRPVVARTLFFLLVVGLGLIYAAEHIFRQFPDGTHSGYILVGLYFVVVVPAGLRILGYAGCLEPFDSIVQESPFQLSIWQILGLTTLTAVTLTVAQSEIARSCWRAGDLWPFLVLFPGIAAWVVLGVSPPVAIGLLLSVVAFAISVRGPRVEVAVLVFFAVTVVVPLFVCRSVGFRLVRIKTPPATIKPKQSIAAIDSYFTEHDHP